MFVKTVAPALCDALAVFEKQLERGADGGEGEVGPGDVAFAEHLHVEAFDAGRVIEIDQFRQIKQVDLVHVGDVEHGEQGAEFDIRARFLDGLADGGGGGGFFVLHETGRQCPVTVARLDGTLAQQHF